LWKSASREPLWKSASREHSEKVFSLLRTKKKIFINIKKRWLKDRKLHLVLISRCFVCPTMENKFLILLLTIAVQFLSTEGRTCHFYDYSKSCSGSNCPLSTIQCKDEQDKCFSVYGYATDGTLKAFQIGCWKQDDGCSQTACIFRKVASIHFCCCTGDLCNSSRPTGVKVPAAVDTSK